MSYSAENFMIIAEIVSQHAEEAAFLWLLRNNAIHAMHYTLKDHYEFNDHIEAHIDCHLSRRIGDRSHMSDRGLIVGRLIWPHLHLPV